MCDAPMLPWKVTLACGRLVEVKAFHCIDTVEFLEARGVITLFGGPAGWRRYIIERAPTPMETLWGKRKTVFIQDAEPDAYFADRPDYLGSWLVYVWLHCDESVRRDPEYRSQLVIWFFRQDFASFEEVIRDAVSTLDWNATAEDIPANRWPWIDEVWPVADDETSQDKSPESK